MAENDSTSLHLKHDNYEQYVNTKLEEMGFSHDDLTYHGKMEKSTAKLLSRRYSSTALYIRTRADRVAIHNDYLIEFQYEIKTHDSKDKRYQDMTIELLPLCVHILNARVFSVRCMYIYYNPNNGDEAAFWSTEIPPIREIHLPTRWNNGKLNYFKRLAASFFPGIPTKRSAPRGSGDPFVIIDQSTLKKLPNWEQLIAEDVIFFRNIKDNNLKVNHNGQHTFQSRF